LRFAKYYPKGVSRNQLLNDLLAVAIDQVSSSLPDGVSDAYEHAVAEHHEGLTQVLEHEGTYDWSSSYFQRNNGFS
jgi:hypothetical protein